MLGKPKQPFAVSEDKGILRVSMSKQALLYYIAFVVGFLLLNFLILTVYVVMNSPLTKTQWYGVLILGAMGTVPGVIFLVLLLRRKPYAFDRGTGRFLQGTKLIFRIEGIQYIQVHREQNARNKKQFFFALSVVPKEGEPHLMFKWEAPATELLALAEKIANYLGTSVHKGEDLAASLAELQTEYKKWDAFSFLLFLLFASTTGLAWWWGLQKVGDWNSTRFPEAIYYLAPTRLAWALPAIFLGIVSADLPMRAVYRWLLKNKYQEFVRYQALYYGVKTAALTKPVYLFVGVVSLLMILMFLDFYVVFTRGEIVINPLFSVLEQRHAYNDIKEITTAPQFIAPNGNVVSRREYIIRFSDGSTWSTHFAPSELDAAHKSEVLKFVASQSNVPIRELEVFRKDELY